ncbi:MAG: hypothetical protein WD491_12375 [Balneolales bacterium]
MQIFSDYNKDIPSAKTVPGSYEWWYFDGVSYDEQYRFVVIFYEGNPFSTKYIRNLSRKNYKKKALAENYPAISISVYENDEPIYCCLSEYPPEDCSFSKDRIEIKVGDNTLTAINDDGDVTYLLNLYENLPSGDRLNADLSFKSEDIERGLLTDSGKKNTDSEGHMWNLVQPRANVSGRIYIYENSNIIHRIKLAGIGYHDHNLGTEPAKEEFVNWYWGRFHFDKGTLVYYVMNRKGSRQQKAWLIGPQNQECLMEFSNIILNKSKMNRFLLASNRNLEFKNDHASVFIQQNKELDSGPFYMRFASDAVLYNNQSGKADKSTGVTEYLKPDRIYSRIFWPLVNMRQRYVRQKPHWVQKSSKLYRWTW